ncbi:MAG TPA: hypothetical protein DC042_05410 [Bacteroidales bacterium]|nr:hypothetical protein [Bacteroidales bacterium]
MKKLAMFILMGLAMLIVMPSNLNAAVVTKKVTHTAVYANEGINTTVLINRLEEIRAMNRSDMTTVEKRQLRQEVRAIRSNLTGGGVIYISAGTLLLIILLLLILL